MGYPSSLCQSSLGTRLHNGIKTGVALGELHLVCCCFMWHALLSAAGCRWWWKYSLSGVPVWRRWLGYIFKSNLVFTLCDIFVWQCMSVINVHPFLLMLCLIWDSEGGFNEMNFRSAPTSGACHTNEWVMLAFYGAGFIATINGFFCAHAVRGDKLWKGIQKTCTMMDVI